MQWIIAVNKYFLGVGVPILLISVGLFYFFRLKCFYVIHPIKSIKCLFTRNDRGVSSLRAVSLALAGTLGVGNMVGVASAISLGGVGAVFWMWVSALVAMVLKYAEIVLAMCFRKFDAEGRAYGGAVYYIRALFRDGKLGRALAAVFALLCIMNAVTMGGMIQVNAAAEAVCGISGISQSAVGAAFALIVFFAMRRGRQGIMALTDRIVPIMTVGFVILSLAVILLEPQSVLEALEGIFSEAFSYRSGVGGIVGFFTSDALRYGTMRGILSNEAGCGTAPTAHAVAECDMPAKQGVWGIFEVFVDTVVLCTLTAVVIIVSGVDRSGNAYMMMTVNAYSSLLGNWAGALIVSSVVMFALATVLCWGYYGLSGVRYFSKNKAVTLGFCLLYCTLAGIGAISSPDTVWELADFAIGAMILINLCVIAAMSKRVAQETELYFNS